MNSRNVSCKTEVICKIHFKIFLKMFYSNQPEQILATQNPRKYLRYTYEKRGGTLFLFANDMIIYIGKLQENQLKNHLSPDNNLAVRNKNQ